MQTINFSLINFDNALMNHFKTTIIQKDKNYLKF